MFVHAACDVGVVEKEDGLVRGKERLDRDAVALGDASVRDQEIERVQNRWILSGYKQRETRETYLERFATTNRPRWVG